MPHHDDPSTYQLAEREQRFGDVWDVPEDDPRLGWGVIMDLNDGGVVLWGVSWSVEAYLRMAHRMLVTAGQAGPDVDTWLITVGESRLFRDTFVEVVNGARMMSGTREQGWSMPDALQFLQACQDQAMDRMGLDRPLWPAPLALRAAERPTRRFDGTQFIDEALTDRLAEHLLVAAEQRVLHRTLDDQQGPSRPAVERIVARPRL